MLLGLSGPPRERERDCPVESLRETERAGRKNLDFSPRPVSHDAVTIIRTRQRETQQVSRKREKGVGGKHRDRHEANTHTKTLRFQK